MRYLSLAVKLLLFFLLLGFAAKNNDPVVLRYFLGLEWDAPLSLVLFIFFAAGLLVGLLLGTARRWRQWRELATLRKSTKTEKEN